MKRQALLIVAPALVLLFSVVSHAQSEKQTPAPTLQAAEPPPSVLTNATPEESAVQENTTALTTSGRKAGYSAPPATGATGAGPTRLVTPPAA